MKHLKHSKLLLWTLWVLAMVLIIYYATKISFVFQPLFVLFSTLFIPILSAGFLFYLLNPLISVMQKFKIKRSYAIILVMFLFLGGATIFIIKTFPILMNQLSDLVANSPAILSDIEIQTKDIALLSPFNNVDLDETLNQLNLSLDAFSKTILSSFTTSISSIIGAIANLTIVLITVPIVLFYMFRDGEKLQLAVTHLFPNKYQKHVFELLHQTNIVITAYISGKGLASIVVAVLIYFGFLIIGLPYTLLLAIVNGFTNLIPYIGPFIGAVPAILVALTISPTTALLVALIVLVVQQLDANFLTPKFVGKSLAIHPLTIIIILLVAGKMLGIIGIIFGVPAFAVIKTIVIYIKNTQIAEEKH
ncbi:AI-2E family transporter [Carnobacterium viridans]|uniref:Predicted PurR-regulated permease PerM n=1 Tax=Carnobacterium viridans TaxID=174587 RepID=A0A1H1AA60_9LACT|nr:AI-2E family transporter [Carnobacterium viridans]UDE94240.1 AI-2E family transporter [Carnobacterium viridans]SDQ36470.1 Predicted PurR-regulated permease PerM [Carnobacterium viridans]